MCLQLYFPFYGLCTSAQYGLWWYNKGLLPFRWVILSGTDNFNWTSRPDHKKQYVWVSHWSFTFWMKLVKIFSLIAVSSVFTFPKCSSSVTWQLGLCGWFSIMVCKLPQHLVVSNKFQFWSQFNKSWKAFADGTVKDSNETKVSDISNTETCRSVLSAWQTNVPSNLGYKSDMIFKM